jgi:hypothetical protein
MKPVLAMMVVVLAACANSTPSPAESSRPQIEPTVRMESPVRVTWEEVSRTETQAVVLAKLERVNKLDMSFLMSVELPAGVKVLEGRTQLTLLPNTEAVMVTEKLVLAFESAPAEDAVLKLDGDSGAMGFHYKVPYRFGRPAPEERGPAATGVAPVRNGKSLGPSVPLK